MTIKLLDLPNETLIEIFSLLDWKDILRIRQVTTVFVCKNLPLMQLSISPLDMPASS